MQITYGEGFCERVGARFQGKIILSDHKLFLKDLRNEDIPSTYVPLEKIQCIQRVGNNLRIHVRLTASSQYTIDFGRGTKDMYDLLQEIVRRRGLKKKFLKSEWVEDTGE